MGNDKTSKDLAEAVSSLKSVKTPPQENYRIVYVDFAARNANKHKYRPSTIRYFKAANDIEANEYLEQYKKEHVAEENCGLFWSYANTTVDCNGRYYDDVFDDLENYIKSKTIIERFSTWWYVHVSSKLSDFWYWLKDLAYWIKTKHNRKESWEIFSSMMAILTHNLPLLIKNHMGVPTRYCVEARKKLHENDKDFDLDESFRSNPNSDEEELKLASQLYEEDLKRLLLNVRLLDYYESFGIVDENNPIKLELKKNYPIPYKKGSWKCIDYEELNRLSNECNDAIFTQLKEMGRCLWD